MPCIIKGFSILIFHDFLMVLFCTSAYRRIRACLAAWQFSSPVSSEVCSKSKSRCRKLLDVAMDVSIIWHIGVDDCIRFYPGDVENMRNPVNDLCYGRIVAATIDTVEVILYKRMTSALLQQFSLPPLHTDSFPTAAISCMVEVIAVEQRIILPRSRIYDIIFIVPLAEVESGLFFMSGACNIFFQRYVIFDGTAVPCNQEYYFCRRFIQPFSIRIFHSLNHLAQQEKKSMYHQSEAELSLRMFRTSFSMEAFAYLSNRLLDTCIQDITERKQAMTVYYDSLSMEARSIVITKSYIRVMSRRGLEALVQE